MGQSLKTCVEEQLQAAETRIKEAPIPAFLIALGIGYIVRFLPVGFLLNLILRTTLLLLKPALVVFGIVQLGKIARKKAA